MNARRLTDSGIKKFKNHVPMESQSVTSSKLALRANLDPENMPKTELAQLVAHR